MATPVRIDHGMRPSRTPIDICDSARKRNKRISGLPPNRGFEADLSSFKYDHEHIESGSLAAAGANHKIPGSRFEGAASKMKPKKEKKILPDPPAVLSISDFSDLTRRSVTIGESSNDDKPAINEQSFKRRSFAKLKRRITDASETATRDYQRARDLEALKAFAEHVSATVDPSMTLYLERTLYAALQHSWILGLGGVGLMSVGNGTNDAIKLGIVLLAMSMVSAVSALVLHYVRLRQIKTGSPFRFWQTALFTSILTLCILVTLVLEIYFGILYPYLLRTATVSIENPEDLLVQHSKK
ncbi:MAG: hypothetical protein SGBAC_009888 [Bacillariaceae sp.]